MLSADLPLALALAAGTVAAFNPCGFAMLPAYLTMLIVDDGGGRRRTAGPYDAARCCGRRCWPPR
nr:hypothetical protein GCM10020093_110440 [Planobispora longispora]